MIALAKNILASGYRVALVAAGGGSGALHALLSKSGASQFLLEAQIPYSTEAMVDYLGVELDSYCSKAAAIVMATCAFKRATLFLNSTEIETPIAGISCTAALQTLRKRRGHDRAFFCIKTQQKEVVRELKLPFGTRQEQESIVSDVWLSFMAEFFQEVDV